ncbi:hypothetical protein [Humisphaera borealis]|uniref:Uncharacterized protein n=1 Tax=Humisphaera borealis TaxID=2807512 RepID=A0A7M2WQA4_9BACT|nr:hypothetical protein [Humisphaera borealis]QOV87668.1 hypothetical protein IPV69_15390 [Humisphaera borealis]
MIDEKAPIPKVFIPPAGTQACLIINGTDVGRIVVKGWESSWAFGTFTPLAAFSEYAPLFGVWSLLMHDDEHAPLHETASAALAEAERKMDALHAEVHFPDRDLRVPVGQLNIDGELIEWKML